MRDQKLSGLDPILKRAPRPKRWWKWYWWKITWAHLAELKSLEVTRSQCGDRWSLTTHRHFCHKGPGSRGCSFTARKALLQLLSSAPIGSHSLPLSDRARLCSTGAVLAKGGRRPELAQGCSSQPAGPDCSGRENKTSDVKWKGIKRTSKLGAETSLITVLLTEINKFEKKDSLKETWSQGLRGSD